MPGVGDIKKDRLKEGGRGRSVKKKGKPIGGKGAHSFQFPNEEETRLYRGAGWTLPE